MPTIENIIRAMTLAGSASAAFEQLLEQVVRLFGAADQATLKEAYAHARADNDEGHRRLQEKLSALAAEGDRQ